MIGSIIQGATSVASGIAGLVGARKDKLAAENAANQSWQRNYEAQKEFAQNSIQWRVQDAKNAGINPYAVVGGQTAGYTPQDTSYQTSYQHAASQAMNGLGDAMGQLNMAMAQEDLKGKKLDNDAKTVELINKMFEARLGNTSATLQQPHNVTHTNPVKGVGGLDHITLPSGEQVPVPSGGADIEDPSKIMQLLNAWFDPSYAENLKAANQGRGKTAYTWSGWRYFPEGVEPDRTNVRAAWIAQKLGPIAASLTLPWNWAIGDFVEDYDKKLKKGRMNKNILNNQKKLTLKDLF